MLTVAELIRLLEQQPQDLVVRAGSDNGERFVIGVEGYDTYVALDVDLSNG